MESRRTEEWVTGELAGADLGDARREARLREIVSELSRDPEGSLNEAAPDAAARKAAYRFCSNEQIAPEAIVKAHRESAWRRVKPLTRVLVAQDTTTLDYSRHPATKDLGPLTEEGGQGYFVHTGLGMGEQGDPLGVLHQEIWVRDAAEGGKSRSRRKRPWSQKESYKWQRTVEEVSKHQEPGQQLIIIGDRESDVYGLLASERAPGVELLVRAAQDRKLATEEGLLFAVLAQTPVAGVTEVEVGRGREREPRTARCEVRYRAVVLRPPRHPDPEVPKQPVRVWAVLVTEPDPPAGEEPIHWLLLATWPVVDLAGALECTRWYALRWRVERYHYILKSGCHLEESQLRTQDRLARLEAIYVVVAWRILWLTYRARTAPEESCEPVFTEVEWRLAMAQGEGRVLPPEAPAPTIHEMLRAVAKMGGWWGRKGDGEPGVKVIWRGLTRLANMVEGFRLAAFMLGSQARDVGNA